MPEQAPGSEVVNAAVHNMIKDGHDTLDVLITVKKTDEPHHPVPDPNQVALKQYLQSIDVEGTYVSTILGVRASIPKEHLEGVAKLDYVNSVYPGSVFDRNPG